MVYIWTVRNVERQEVIFIDEGVLYQMLSKRAAEEAWWVMKW